MKIISGKSLTLILCLGGKVICSLLEFSIPARVLMSSCPADNGNFVCKDYFTQGDSGRTFANLGCEPGRGREMLLWVPLNAMHSCRKLRCLLIN